MHAGREPPQQLGVATADHHAVDLQPESEQIDHFENVAPPFFLARSLQARRADILFVGSPFFERQVRELHRLEPAVDDHGGAEAGAETEKQHASARIAAERLHRGIVDHFHRPAECAPEIEANPTLAEVNRLAHRLAVYDRRGIADRDRIVLPVGGRGRAANQIDHLLWCHLSTRRNLDRDLVPGEENLDVRAADVNDQNAHAESAATKQHETDGDDDAAHEGGEEEPSNFGEDCGHAEGDNHQSGASDAYHWNRADVDLWPADPFHHIWHSTPDRPHGKIVEMQLKSHTVLVTGGATGIGLALAVRFLKAGSDVIVCGRREDKLRAVAATHPRLNTRVCDLAREADRVSLVASVTRDFPQLDVIVNNAGIQRRVQLADQEPWRDAREEIAINLEAPLHLSRLFIPHLLKQQHPAIINVTSGLAFAPLASVPVYCATKAAPHSFTLSLRHQLSGTPIEVIEVLPPAVDTDLGGPGLHTFGVALDEFANAVMPRLESGDLEIAYGFAEQSSRASRAELDAIFKRLNEQTRRP